jgi:hypothetical protein
MLAASGPGDFVAGTARCWTTHNGYLLLSITLVELGSLIYPLGYAKQYGDPVMEESPGLV